MSSSSTETEPVRFSELDYDYIGTGGFLIVCGSAKDEGDSVQQNEPGEVFGVTKEQAQLILRHCPFFEKCLKEKEELELGNSFDGCSTLITMKEAHERVVHKPDWSLAIARHFVEVLTKGKTAVPTLHLYEELLAAGDQVLVDLRLTSMLNYMDVCKKDNEFSRLVDPKLYRFRFRAQVTGDQWLQLLGLGVLLFRQETNYVVQRWDDEVVLDQHQIISRRKLDNRYSEFLVHADRAIDAILKIQQCLCNTDATCLDEKSPRSETFSVYFETTEPVPKDHHQLIDRLAGGEAYIRTCADAVEHQTEGYTVKASLDVLARAIRPVKESSVIHCSLRLDNPSPDTLGRFVNACQRAKAHPSTLGMDASINRYFCRKSMGDILMVLEYMANYSTTSKIQGDFTVLELSSEDKPF